MALTRAGYDVCIIGGGPVGSATAIAFARRGARVLVLEKDPRASRRFAGEWIHPAGVDVLDALRAGSFFVTSGEVLLHDYSIQGTGGQRAFVADVDWTWPGEFVELVWGDGKTTGREITSATSLAPFSTHQYRIPFDAAGKKWVRFAAWDAAGNGAFTQPVHLK